MQTVKARLLAALQAICARLLLPPEASRQEQEAAIRDAYALAHDALGLRAVFDSEDDEAHEAYCADLPD